MPSLPFQPLFAASVPIFILLVAACGGSDDDRQAKIDLLISEGETQESAECYVDELAGYDLAEFQVLSSADDFEEVNEEFFQAAVKASELCE